MGRDKCDHIKWLITLSNDNIKRLSLQYIYLVLYQVPYKHQVKTNLISFRMKFRTQDAMTAKQLFKNQFTSFCTFLRQTFFTSQFKTQRKRSFLQCSSVQYSKGGNVLRGRGYRSKTRSSNFLRRSKKVKKKDHEPIHSMDNNFFCRTFKMFCRITISCRSFSTLLEILLFFRTSIICVPLLSFQFEFISILPVFLSTF